jgi:hypothetical protein
LYLKVRGRRSFVKKEKEEEGKKREKKRSL